MSVNDFLHDDDGALDAAKKLLAESPEELEARVVAQALRLQRCADTFVDSMSAESPDGD